MSKKLCCTSTKHPNDWYCTWIQLLDTCPERIPRVGKAKSTARAVADTWHEDAEATIRQEIEPYEPDLDWLIGFIDALDVAETEPSTAQLLALAQALQEAGVFDDALQVSKYLEYRLLDALSDSLIKAYEVQFSAYQALDDPAAAETVRKLSNHVEAVRRFAGPNR